MYDGWDGFEGGRADGEFGLRREEGDGIEFLESTFAD